MADIMTWHARLPSDRAYTDARTLREQAMVAHIADLEEALAAAIAAQQAAPAARLTDEQIRAVATAAYKSGKLSWLGFDKDADDKYTIPVLSGSHYQFARAIEAAAAPNAAMVQAMTEMVSWFGRYPEWLPVPETFDNYKASIAKARAALASLPVPPKEA